MSSLSYFTQRSRLRCAHLVKFLLNPTHILCFPNPNSRSLNPNPTSFPAKKKTQITTKKLEHKRNRAGGPTGSDQKRKIGEEDEQRN